MTGQLFAVAVLNIPSSYMFTVIGDQWGHPLSGYRAASFDIRDGLQLMVPLQNTVICLGNAFVAPTIVMADVLAMGRR